MSKSFSLILSVFLFVSAAASGAAQDLKVVIKIVGAKAMISGTFAEDFKRTAPGGLAFLKDQAGVSGLADRVANISTSRGAWQYEVDLTPQRKTAAAAAHVSWVAADVGLLFTDDLLPQEGKGVSAAIRLEVPEGWMIFSAAERTNGAFHVADIEKASFIIGRGLRSIPAGECTLVLQGEWQFTDKEAGEAANEIYAFYKKAFGSGPDARPQIALLKPPSGMGFDQWEADTRGAGITVVSGDAAFASQAKQRLHEQLRHEIFHLWFPNAVRLSGNYDWFYEGFALYQSLKLGVAVNRIRFDDYLDTLSRAYVIDNFVSSRVSLIEGSKTRFRGGDGTQVYARGMLVAFLCDLALIEASNGKRSTDDLVREIYQKYSAPGPRTDGNDAILAIMKSRPELTATVDSYVTGAAAISWGSVLSEAGLEIVQTGRPASLRVVAKPNGRQKTILNKLGYNNWRKSSSK